MNKITRNTINRKKVMISTFFIPLAIPIFLIYLFFSIGDQNENILGFFFLAMFIGAIFYLPTIIGALILEAIAITPKATKNTVAIVLASEDILAFLIIGYSMEFFEYAQEALIPLSICIVLPQLMRWFWLSAKNRMYNKDTSPLS